MKLVCPQCRTAYDVAPTALGSAGRQVRCVRCKAAWFAEAPRLGDIVNQPLVRDVHLAPPPGAARTAPAAALEAETAAPPLAPTPQPPAPASSPPDSAAAGPAASVAPPGPAESIPAETAATVAPEPAAPPLAPAEPAPDAVAADAPATPEAPAQAPPADIESLAARRLAARRAAKRPQRQRRRFSKLVAATVALAAVNAGVIACRADVVRYLPQTASLFEAIGLPVNLRGLAFRNVKTSEETHDGVKILVVEGSIIATGHDVTDVPRLRFAIGAANGHEIYAWTALPTRTRLAPGETLAFRTRLASPPEQGRTVKVRFFTRLDLATGLR